MRPDNHAVTLEKELKPCALDLAEFREIYRDLAPGLRRTLTRLTGGKLDVDDLLQDVFVVAWQRRAILRPTSSPRPWLYGIALKVAAAARRRSGLRQWLGLEEAEQVAATHTPVRSVESQEAQRTVHQILEKLTPKKKTVFVLFELEGMSGEEIAQILGCPTRTVWSRLFYARRDFLVLYSRSKGDSRD